MSRRHLAFDCAGSTLAATLDDAQNATGLLIITGGNETRAGAFSSQASLAARVASAGHPVFRFSRRGVGDSEGVNMGFRNSGEDIAAAASEFRAQCPALERIVALGNCDAASTLMLERGASCDALVLSNPWTYEEARAGASPPSAAIRARYAEKLTNPRELLRLFTGKVNLTKLVRGVLSAASPAAARSALGQDMADGLARFAGPVRILIAERDRTGQEFLAGWDTRDARIRRCAGASHAYVEPEASDWLFAQLIEALADK